MSVDVNSTLTFRRKTVAIEQFGVQLVVIPDRAFARSARRRDWREYDGTRMPRLDDEIMVAWVRRALNGMGFEVQPPQWFIKRVQRPPDYDVRYLEFVRLSVLVPTTEYEAEQFSGLRLPPEWRHYTFIDLEEET